MKMKNEDSSRCPLGTELAPLPRAIAALPRQMPSCLLHTPYGIPYAVPVTPYSVLCSGVLLISCVLDRTLD